MLPSFKLQSLGAAQTNVPFTLGHVFAPGDMAAGRGLIARAADSSYLPLQVDQKATHADGSVRHAILSGILPALAAGETQSFQLLDADKRGAVQTFAGAPAFVSATIGGVIYTAVLDLLNDKSIWLTGPVVIERQSAAPFVSAAGQIHPHLVARFAVRDYGSAQRVDVTVENNWAYAPGPQNFTYDASVTVAGQVVFAQAALTHLHHGRWRQVFWAGAAPQVHAQVDKAYWMASRALPNYGPEVPTESVLQGYAAALVNAGPMKIGAATAYMPTTGAHPDIGILPQWQWADVMSQDSRARAVTLITADGSGSFSMHYRDQSTDLPVSLKDHPRMTIAGRSTDAGTDAFPSPGGDTTSPYTSDISHHPSLAYLPYLLTGDYYYLEELQFWAMYCVFSSNPGYRSAEQGLMIPEQLRGQAWGLRTLAQAAYATPDAHPLKAELARVLDCNHDWYNSNYTNNPNANKIGVLTNGYAIAYDNETATATWMDDFFVQSLGHQIDLGFTKALPLLAWKSKFTLGRMLEVSWTIGAPYGLRVRDTSSSPIYDSIKQCYTAVLGETFMALPWASPVMAEAWNASGYPMNMYPSDGVYAGDMGNIAFGYEGYPSNMQGALSVLVDYGIPGAPQGWDNFMARTVKCDYTLGGQFNLAPRDYTAKPVAPYVDPDAALDWKQIATEGETVTVPDNTEVRYGANGLFVKKVLSGAVLASNATFGDPAPGVVKTLQQLISDTVTVPPTQPPQGDKMTYKLTVVLAMAAQQLDAQSQAAPTTIRGEVLTADGQTVVASVDNGPFEFPGLAEGDYVFRASGLDSNAVVMGVPFQVAFTANDVTAPPGDPVPGGTIDVQLPSGAALTLTREQ